MDQSKKIKTMYTPTSKEHYRTFEAAYVSFPTCISLLVLSQPPEVTTVLNFVFFCTDFPTNISLCLGREEGGRGRRR